MPKIHSSKLTIRNKWRNTNANGISTPVDAGDYSKTIALADGDGDNEAQDQFNVHGTVLPNDDDAYDLAGGVTDEFGDTLTFATIKEIMLVNLATEVGHDLVLGAGGHPTGGALATSIFDGDVGGGNRIKAGGYLVLGAPLTGYAVTGGSADILRVYNAGSVAIEYDLIIKGTR